VSFIIYLALSLSFHIFRSWSTSRLSAFSLILSYRIKGPPFADMKRNSSSHAFSQLLVSVPEPVLPEDQPQRNRIIGDCRESLMRESSNFSKSSRKRRLTAFALASFLLSSFSARTDPTTSSRNASCRHTVYLITLGHLFGRFVQAEEIVSFSRKAITENLLQKDLTYGDNLWGSRRLNEALAGFLNR